MHEKKELHFFDWYYDKGIDWYEREFAGARVKAVGEATPAYLYHERIASLIKRQMPEIKLIVSLRDPVERAYSAHRFKERERQEQNISVSFAQKASTGSRTISEGLYFTKLQRYYDLFEKEKILVVLYDELESDPSEYLRRVHRFLDVRDDFRSPLIGSRINSSLTKAELFRQLRNRDSDSDIDVEKVSDETRTTLLRQYYLEDIEKLEGLIHQDLSEWKRAAQ